MEMPVLKTRVKVFFSNFTLNANCENSVQYVPLDIFSMAFRLPISILVGVPFWTSIGELMTLPQML